MKYHGIELRKEKIPEFCHRNHIRRLAFFGSILREDFDPESDIDVLVEFIPGKEPGLISLAGMELELSEILGRKADLRTADDLSRYFRNTVVETAQEIYAG